MKKKKEFINSDKKPVVKLYRYFSNIKYALQEIQSGEIYLTLSDSFNDPFDCKISNDGSVLLANQKGRVKIIVSFVNNILLKCKDFIESFFQEYDFDAMEKSFLNNLSGRLETTPFEYLHFIHTYSNRKDIFENFIEVLKESFIQNQPIVSVCKRVACFSEINNSILMWSYYANKHKGICLEYTPTELDLEDEYQRNLFNGLQKVFYSENQYNQNKYFYSIDDINDVFFNKAQCWAHEQEWRLVLSKNRKKIKFPCLTGIYLGANFRKEYATLSSDNNFIKVISCACKLNNKLTVYEAKLNNEKYQLDFEKIIIPDFLQKKQN